MNQPIHPVAAGPAPVVGVFSLGGTIAMTSDGVGGAGVTPRLRAADLVAAVPGLEASGVRLELHDVRQLPGASLGLADVAELARVIQEQVERGAIAGAVVTQGTDTIEETGWLLDLLHTGEAPIVVTGAMRNPTQAGADGPANLLAAVRVAASAEARDLGVLVVFNDDVHPARAVAKSHSTSTAAFRSANTGPIGHIGEGILRIWHRPPRQSLPPTIRARAVERIEVPRVAVVPMTLGQDAVLLGAVGGVLDGLVLAAFGVGHVPARVVDSVSDLAARMPVVLASRTGAGPVGASTYSFPGSESDLLARGLIRAGYLDAYKSRLLLQVLLAGGAQLPVIRRQFLIFGGYPDHSVEPLTRAGEVAGARP